MLLEAQLKAGSEERELKILFREREEKMERSNYRRNCGFKSIIIIIIIK